MPPLKFIVVPALVAKVPLPLPPAVRSSVPALRLLVPLGLKLLPKLSTPLWISSVPSGLLKSTAPAVPAVPLATVFCSRPELITTSVEPPSPWKNWSLWIRNCAPALLSNTTCAPPPLVKMLPVPLQVVVPKLSMRRARFTGPVMLRLAPAAIVVVPVLVPCVPPDQVMVLLTVTGPAPFNVPLDRLRLFVATLPVLVSVPPLMASSPLLASEAPPATV